MPSFTQNRFATPFGKNEYLRSTVGIKRESRTVAAETIPVRTIDGNPNQKVLQPGTVMARITSGPHLGKIGPYQPGGSPANEVQTLTPTTVTAGTVKVSLFGGDAVTSALAFNASAATVQTAVRAALAESENLVAAEYADSITVTGSALSVGVMTVTFVNDSGLDVPAVTVDATALTGTVAVATPTPGVAGANDGRQTIGNIVGINDTFLPWQLIERDVEVAVVYEAAVIQANCIELTSTGAETAVSDTTAAGMFAKKNLNITFHTASTEV